MPEGHIPIYRNIVVPIIYKKKLIGAIQVANKETDYDKEDQVLLETIAAHIAPILNAKLERDRFDKRRIKAEQELWEAHYALEARVAERTVQLTKLNEKLRVDIAEREQLEKALNLEKEKLRKVYENSPDAVLILDKDYKILYANRHTEGISGVCFDKLKGKKCYQAIIGSDNICNGCMVNEVIDEKEVKENIKHEITVTGRENWLWQIWYPILDSQGDVESVLEIAKDITGTKKKEEVLKRSNQNQTVLNTILNLSLKSCSLQEILDSALEYIVSVPWLTLDSKGIIFIVEDNPEELVMKSCQGVTFDQRKKCSPLPFGKCICGLAASTKEIQFSNSIDGFHDIRPDNIFPHGHYCVPILLADRVLGVLALYTKKGHVYDEQKKETLNMIANVLAGIIERKRTEDKLKLLQNLLDHVNDSVVVADPKTGRYLYVNDKACAGRGYTREEHLSLGVADILGMPRQLALFVWKTHVKVLKKKGNMTTEILHKRKDGSTFPVEASVNYISLEGKDYLVSISRDLSERKHAERNLNLVRLLINHSSDAMFLIDPDTANILDANQRACEILGYAREELLSIQMADLISELRSSDIKWKARIDELRKKEDVVEELICKRKDGLTFPVELNIRYIYQDKQEYFVLAMRDITERKRAEQALMESEERYRILADTANDAMFLADIETGIIVDANKGAEKLLSLSRDDIIGLHQTQLHPKEKADYYSKLFGQCAQKEEFFAEGIYVSDKAGHKIPVEISSRITEISGRKFMHGIFRDVTEHKRAEEKLQASEKRFRDLATCSSDWFWEVDVEGRYTYCSEQVVKVLGYTAEEMLGKTPFDFMPPEEVACIREKFEKIVKTQEAVIDLETWNINKEGKSVCLLTNGVPIYDKKGDFAGYRGVDKDITERKQAEKTLKDSEELFRTIFEYGGLGISLVNMDGWPTFFNPMIQELLGYSKEELCSMHYSEFTYPEDLALSGKYFKEINEGKRDKYQIEKRYIRKDGNLVWCRVTVSVVRDVKNKPLYVIALLENIDERKRVEEELKKFKHISDISSDAYFFVDSNAKFLYVNKTACKLMGYSEDELLTLGVPDVDVVYDIIKYRELFDLIQKEIIPPIETVNKRKDGTIFPSEITVTGYQIGNKPYMFAALRDISSRKEAELQLQKTMEELARSNEDLQQYVNVASHDLQEPLRMVTSFLQLLERRYKGKLDSDADEFIAYAVDGAIRMRALINALLEYSRVGIYGRTVELTDCNAVLEQALVNLQAIIEENGATVTHDLLPTVRADGMQLVQLFQNLIKNAVKFKSEKKPKIHISASQENGEFVFSVSDNGIGIAPEYFEKIFKMFQRLHDRTEYAGTGIGLAICKKIVERHGGQIWLESEPGKGTTFYFTLSPKGGKVL